MTPDVLFWFYKNFDVCEERLRRLRNFNEDVRVFALYGGPLSEAEKAKSTLARWVDDFYIYPDERDAKWKWKHGDQMIAAWFLERGHQLEWGTIFIMQWDMLILASLDQLFSTLQPGQILLSGFRPVQEVESWWPWANPESAELLDFKKLLLSEFGYDRQLFACLFIVVCFPRTFLEKYVEASVPEVGFLEYKIPTMAKVFGIEVCKNHGFNPWWAANPATSSAPSRQKILNAIGQEVPFWVVLKEISVPDGNRLFHPFFKTFPSWMADPNKAIWLSYLFRCLETPKGILKKRGKLLGRIIKRKRRFT